MTFPDYSLEKVIYSATLSPLKEYAFPFSYVNANLSNFLTQKNNLCIYYHIVLQNTIKVLLKHQISRFFC
jgi:hypothetical protein